MQCRIQTNTPVNFTAGRRMLATTKLLKFHKATTVMLKIHQFIQQKSTKANSCTPTDLPAAMSPRPYTSVKHPAPADAPLRHKSTKTSARPQTCQRQCHPGHGINHPKKIGVIVVYHHMAPYLPRVKTVPPYFQQAHRLESYDMENKYI